MLTVTVHRAKTQLSRLIAAAERGEQVVIARGRTSVARLVAMDATPPRRAFGAMRGRARVTAAFFKPLPPDEQGRWE
jgi:antitoxin (DNA-binding transcriptional repressor) of toxin-antitoxin stability system